jgi:alkyl hydroperoxide reductase subunit AhpC
VTQLRQWESRLDDQGIEVLVVSFQPLEDAQRYVEHWDLPWPMVSDEQRLLYRHYGMRRADWWTVMGPRSWWGYIRLLLAGRKLEMPTADVRQLGGDILIDPTGIVRYHHVTSTPVDRPDIEDLLAAMSDRTST